jgi:hypothetical protein
MTDLRDWVPYVKKPGEEVGVDWGEVERPLHLMIAPGKPDRMLVVWRGVCIGCLVRVGVATDMKKDVIVLTRAPRQEESEESRCMWAEIAASGIEVREEQLE